MYKAINKPPAIPMARPKVFKNVKKGVSWCHRDNVKITDEEKKSMVEYTYIHQEIIDGLKTETKEKKSIIRIHGR